jgi:hypothetical protein
VRSAFALALLLSLALTAPAGSQSAAPGPSAVAGSGAARPPAAADLPDAEVVIAPQGGTYDAVSISYTRSPTNAEMEQDFAAISGNLKKPVVRPEIKRGPPKPDLPDYPSATAQLPGLVNYAAGVINLDPIIDALRRYHHLHFDCLFFNKFNLTWPVGAQQRGPIRWQTDVRGQTVSYDVWIEHGKEVPASVPSTGQWGVTWLWVGGLALGAVLLAGGVFYLVYAATRQRAAAPPEG